MVDVHNPEQRSRNMAAIKGKNTEPELVVRRLLHGLGYRYRLHRRDLPGRPDLVFPKARKIIFVHGCFWHIHDCPNGCVVPGTNIEFWENKRRGNVERDTRNIKALEDSGWNVFTIWECEVRGRGLQSKLTDFLKR
jgi:DNA mismatch endonuclease (patch repair protein)